MKISFQCSQRLPSILISAVIGILLAMIIGMSGLDIFKYGFLNQLLILFFLSAALGFVCYLVLARIPAHFKTLFTLRETGLGAITRKIFLAVFFLFPICLILLQQIVEFLRLLRTGQSSDFIGWLPPATNDRTFFIPVLLFSFFLVLAVLIAGRRQVIRNFFTQLPDFWYIAFILIFSLLIRLSAISLINTQPVSDFEFINKDALALAQGGRPSQMHVETRVMITVVYGFLYHVFGPYLNVLKVFHAVAYGLAGVFLYASGKMIFKSKFWAFIAAVLLVGWPSLVVYSNVLTPEHLFILVECALIFSVAHWFKSLEEAEKGVVNHRSAWYLVWSIAVGILIGVSGMFRPFGELFLVAAILTLLLYIRNLKKLTTVILSILIAFGLVRNIPVTVAKYYQNEFRNVRPCNLLVGLNFKAAGQYNDEDVKLCRKLRSEIPDETALSTKIAEIVWARFQEQKNGSVPFINDKFAILWANSNGILFWTVRQITDGDPTWILATIQKVNLVDFTVMFLVVIACVAGTVIAFFKDVPPPIFFCLLTFFGFNLMEVPFEVQTRYRSAIMPVPVLFACWTFAIISIWMITRYQDQKKG
jgi:hypothetical protein